MYAGGGGSKGPVSCLAPTRGGSGGAGFYNKPITQPFSQPYSIGGGGASAPGCANAGAGGNTTIANVGTVNGGAASPGLASGANGTQPGSNLTIPNRFRPGGFTQQGPNGSQPSDSKNLAIGMSGMSGPGIQGMLIVYENNGT
jgi:hypothetical protein